MGPKSKRTKSVMSTKSRASRATTRSRSRKGVGGVGSSAADRFEALEAEVALLNSVVLLFDAHEDGVKVSILTALNDYVVKCKDGSRTLSQRRVTERILPYLETRNHDLALQTVLLLSTLVESSEADLCLVKSFDKIERLLLPFVRATGVNPELIIATLTLFCHLCADFRFLTKFLALLPMPTLCFHLKNNNHELQRLSLEVLTMLSIDWNAKSQITSTSEFNNNAMNILNSPDQEVSRQMFVLLTSLCRLERNRDWFRDRKLLEATMALLLAEPDDEVLGAAFDALDEALKMHRNVQFIKDKGLLRQLLELSADAGAALQVAVCEMVAQTASVASNRKIYREYEIEKTLGEIMRKETTALRSGCEAVTKLCANGLLRQSLGPETMNVIAGGAVTFAPTSTDDCLTICLESLTALLSGSSENVRLFVDGHHVKPFLKFVIGAFKRRGGGVASRNAGGASNTGVRANAAPDEAKPLKRNRLLCMETLHALSVSKPEELARRDVMALIVAVMAPENGAELKIIAAKTLICLSKALGWAQASPAWVERGGVIALLQLLEEEESICRNVAAILLSTLLAPEGRTRDERLEDSLIDAGCVEALQRVVASPAHALWPNPRERKALEDAVAVSLPAAWAWRGRIEARENMMTSLPFWDGGGAEEGQNKWFKSLGQTRSDRPSPDGHREVVFINLSKEFLEARERFLESAFNIGDIGVGGGGGTCEGSGCGSRGGVDGGNCGGGGSGGGGDGSGKVEGVEKRSQEAELMVEECDGSGSNVEGGSEQSGGGITDQGASGSSHQSDRGITDEGVSGSSVSGNGVKDGGNFEKQKNNMNKFSLSTLDGVAAWALTVLYGVLDPMFRAQAVARYVVTRLGGFTYEDAPNHYAVHVAELKEKFESNIVPLEALKRGGKYHRALLFKLLCDVLWIPCSLERGLDNASQAHIWNTIDITLNAHSVPRVIEVTSDFGEFIEMRFQKRYQNVNESGNFNHECSSSSLTSSSAPSVCRCCQGCRRPIAPPLVPEAKKFRFVVDLMRHPGTLYERSSLRAKEYRGGKVW